MDTSILGMKHRGRWYPFDTYFKAQLESVLGSSFDEIAALNTLHGLEETLGKTPHT